MSEATEPGALSRAWTNRREALVTGVRAHLSFASLLLVLFLTFLDNTIASAVLASVQAKLHAGVPQLQWVVGAYALTFASLMLLFGSLGDNFGRKKIMLIGVVIFCAGSLVCAFAGNPAVLIAGRGVMGVGAAASEPSTLSMIRHIYPDARRRARALGAWAAVSGLALALGPVFGGILVGLWSWRAVFWFNFVFGMVALSIAAIALPEATDDVRRRLDPAGFIFSSVALGFATFATILGETWGYRSTGVISFYVVAAISLGILFAVEARSDHPMVNVRWVTRKPFAGSTIVAFTSNFAIFSIFFFVALYLEVVAQASAFHLAVDFVPMLAGMILAALFTGRWVGRVGSRVPMTTGCLLAGIGVLLTDAVISPTASLGQLGWTMGLAGVGFGIIIVPVNATALIAMPAADSGMAASTINTSRELGAVTGVAVLGAITNGQLTVNLIHKLAQIGVPVALRQTIVSAIITGQNNWGALAGIPASGSGLLNHIVDAAYAAFGHGLDIALTASGLLLLASGFIAYFTGTANPNTLVSED